MKRSLKARKRAKDEEYYEVRGLTVSCPFCGIIMSYDKKTGYLCFECGIKTK